MHPYIKYVPNNFLSQYDQFSFVLGLLIMGPLFSKIFLPILSLLLLFQTFFLPLLFSCKSGKNNKLPTLSRQTIFISILLKAFDTIRHKRLLKKLSACGFKGDFLAWITSFLMGRCQSVRVNNQQSEPGEVKS